MHTIILIMCGIVDIFGTMWSSTCIFCGIYFAVQLGHIPYLYVFCRELCICGKGPNEFICWFKALPYDSYTAS